MHRVIAALFLAATVFGASALPVTNTAASTADQVVRFLEDRLQRDPDDFIAAGKLGHAYLQQARENGTLDSYPKAERMFRLVLKWTPDSYPAGVALGSVLVSQHRFREAAALSGKLTSEYPKEPPAHGVLGDALLEIGDLDGAAAAYAKLGALAPGVSALTRVSRLEWMRGHVPAALTNLTLALQFSNSPAETLAWTRVQRGGLYFRTGRLGEAEQDYTNALREFPNYFLALDHLAELRATQGRYDEAVPMFEALAQRTGRPEYLQAVGDVLTAARRIDEAKPWHDRALAAYLRETGAGNVHYFHHLASFYADVREDGTESEKWARRDLEVRQNTYAWDALGWALFWKKDYAAAETAVRHALVAGTKDAHLFAHASVIMVSAKKITEGRRLMKQAEEANPQFQSFHVHR